MNNILEIIMLLSTFLYSYLILYVKRSSFLFGVIASGIMGVTLIASGVYVQAIVYFAYALMYIYSFFRWGKKDSSNISNIDRTTIIVSLTYIFTFSLVMGYAFSTMGTVYPYIDAFSAACSMTAVFLLGKKIIENSYIFIVSNIASIIICYMTKDYMTILCFVIYMIFNIIRIYTWEKIRYKEKAEQ